ncbi:MAG: dipeptide epimerase [Calditrichia bacterium]
MLSYEIKTLPLKHHWTISRSTSTEKHNVFVRLERDGIVGIGEAAPNSRYDETAESCTKMIEAARPLLEKADWWNYRDLVLSIRQLPSGQNAAKAAIDIALMDWVCKSLNTTLYRFWGLDKTKAPLTTYSIGIDTPEIMAKWVQEASEFKVLKIKLGTDNDEAIIEAIRGVTDRPLRVDANEAWKTVDECVAKINWLEGQGIEFVEQPMPSHMLTEMAAVRKRINIPVVADESVKSTTDIPLLADAFDGINIKVMKSGGLQEAKRMIELAKLYDMKIMLGCMVESSVAISAAAALSPLADWADLDGNLLLADDPFSGVTVEEGRLVLNDEPGIGLRQ